MWAKKETWLVPDADQLSFSMCLSPAHLLISSFCPKGTIPPLAQWMSGPIMNITFPSGAHGSPSFSRGLGPGILC